LARGDRKRSTTEIGDALASALKSYENHS
jgi:hypothetical protein